MESASLTGTCSLLPSAGVWNEAVSSPRRLRVGTGGGGLRQRLHQSHFGTVHRRAAGTPHHPRPHPGDQRRELLPQARQGERSLEGFRRTGRQAAFCGINCPSLSTSWRTPHSIPYVVQVGHNYSVPLAHILGAIDRRIRKVGRPIALVFWMSGFVPIPRRSTPGNWSCYLGAFTYF